MKIKRIETFPQEFLLWGNSPASLALEQELFLQEADEERHFKRSIILSPEGPMVLEVVDTKMGYNAQLFLTWNINSNQ